MFLRATLVSNCLTFRFSYYIVEYCSLVKACFTLWEVLSLHTVTKCPVGWTWCKPTDPNWDCQAAKPPGTRRWSLRCFCRMSRLWDTVLMFCQGKASTRDKQADERTLSHRQDENRHSTRNQVTRSTHAQRHERAPIAPRSHEMFSLMPMPQQILSICWVHLFDVDSCCNPKSPVLPVSQKG